MQTIQITLSDEEYERLRQVATCAGDSTAAAAQKLLRAALERLEPSEGEKLLHAIEAIHQQYGKPQTADAVAIIREFRERDA